MIEVEKFERGMFAIVRDRLEPPDYERIAEMQGLWLTPETADFTVESPLRVPRLRTLYVANCRQRMFDMVTRDSMVNLEWLLVARAPESLVGIGELGEFRRLERLKILEQELTAEVATWIAQQSKLKMLALNDTNASDATIAHLGCRERLRRLDIFRSEVSFSQTKLFEGPFPVLRSLDVSETSVSSASVETITWLFPALERLIAQNTKLEIRGLKEIATWPRLKILDSGTPEVDFDRHGDPFWDL